jgi:hypothetical protein
MVEHFSHLDLLNVTTVVAGCKNLHNREALRYA